MHAVVSLSTLVQALSEAGSNKVSLIWKHQLMQFNNLSDHMAAAIVSNYSSPSHLLSVCIHIYMYLCPIFSCGC